MAAAVDSASSNSRATFLHPYDNPYGIAGQSLVGSRILQELEMRNVDLTKENVLIAVQAGGGSPLTGIACRIMQARREGHVGNNVQLRAVQPINCDALYRAQLHYPPRRMHAI